MKGFAILLPSAIFVVLIAGTIQSISADHLEPGPGIFTSEQGVELITTKGTNYQIYLQTVFRSGDGQLISVIESTAYGAYIPHKISDHVFDTLMGKKEIITIDNKTYEKVQYIITPTLEQRWVGLYPIFSEIELKYDLSDEAAVERMNTAIDNVSIWKIHYCGDFKGHGYQCLPIFQVLVPTMTMAAQEDIIQQWTVLRELN